MHHNLQRICCIGYYFEEEISSKSKGESIMSQQQQDVQFEKKLSPLGVWGLAIGA